MNIWNVQSRTNSRLTLWRTGEGMFRVIEDGPYTALIENPVYTLLNKKYALLFEELDGQVTLKPANIQDFQFQTQSLDYVELVFTNTISPETISSFVANGHSAWGYCGSLFVSEDLKYELEKLGSDELEFHLGFSRFAA